MANSSVEISAVHDPRDEGDEQPTCAYDELKIRYDRVVAEKEAIERQWRVDKVSTVFLPTLAF
jgi:hypothetical protein